MDDPPDRDALIEAFRSFTQASPQEAAPALAANDWNVEQAVSMWFAQQEGDDDHDGDDDDEQDPDYNEGEEDDTAAGGVAVVPSQSSGGGRTLGGGPAASGSTRQLASSSSSRRAAASGSGKMRTMDDLRSDNSHAGHGHGPDDDDEQQDLFAGGEKSGLAVQNPGNNPRDQINDLLDRARRNAPHPGGEGPDDSGTSFFSGRGVTLGGDDAPSRVIDDPRGRVPEPPPPRVRRVLHIWQDGFSIDDGALFRYDDPANAETLRIINSGRAPLDLLNVEPGQEVDLELDPQKETKYAPPKKKYVPFSGQGQRLGSPTAAPSTSIPDTVIAAASSSPSSSAPSGSTGSTDVTVDSSQPTITLQIRLGDGTRLQSRFNPTHTIGDVYQFVNRASTASNERPYALMTTFPSKELEDREAKLGDFPEFKRGGVVVQKWK